MSFYTIVSFCGGGIRGLLSARILQRLAAINSTILDQTSLLAGTSAGAGIVGLMLAKQTPADICNYYLETERKFFSKPASTSSSSPRYSVQAVWDGNFRWHGEKTLGDIKDQKVLFTSFFVGETIKLGIHLQPKIPWGPRLYTNLATSGTPSIRIADAVTQSSAMPGMMGSWQDCVDGAFVNHDPTLAAIALAIANGAKLDNIAVINIGTGLMPDWIASDTSTWGAEQWLNGGPDNNAGNQTPPFVLNWKTATPMLDMALCGTSANLTPMLAKMMLGNRYVNINPQLPWNIPEDSTSDKDFAALEDAGTTTDLTEARAVLANYWPASLTG